MSEKMISVIIPSFNEEKMIEKTAKVIHNLLFNALIEHVLIFVDDGSMDSTWEKIKNVAKKQNSVRGIHFPEILEKRLQYLLVCNGLEVLVV